MVLARMVVLLALLALPLAASADDVYVDGYYRRDGTYVRPHIRSSPDGYRSNNYGPSRNSYELMNPWSRNADGDSTPNYLDYDDDNDGVLDDYDFSQY